MCRCGSALDWKRRALPPDLPIGIKSDNMLWLHNLKLEGSGDAKNDGLSITSVRVVSCRGLSSACSMAGLNLEIHERWRAMDLACTGLARPWSGHMALGDGQDWTSGQVSG